MGRVCAEENVTRWAVLDMGSNTFLLLVAEWYPALKRLRIIDDVHSIAKLGASVSETQQVEEQGVNYATAIATFYNNLCVHHKAQKVWAIGTAVFRHAINAQEVLDKLGSCFTIPFRSTILSPEQEAILSFWGAELPKRTQHSLVIDVGGGSTEISIGKRWDVMFHCSLPIGALWLSDKVKQLRWDLETTYDFVNSLILKELQFNGYSSLCERAYALAGTPVTIAGILAGIPYEQWWRMHNYEIPRDALNRLLPWLWEQGAKLRYHPSVHPERADILPAGALILDALMSYLQLPSVYVSIYGLRYGALCELLRSEGLLDFADDFDVEDPRLSSQ